MKFTICDRCGCTNKPIGRAQIVSDVDEFVFTDVTCDDFRYVEGYDLCGACYLKWLRVNKDRISRFIRN
jgi:hypothetical protein